MKKLFSDPHYNVMDGLDIYIDDYGKPDPIPLEMLRRMAQSHALGLFADDEEQAGRARHPATRRSTAGAAAEAAPPETAVPTDRSRAAPDRREAER